MFCSVMDGKWKDVQSRVTGVQLFTLQIEAKDCKNGNLFGSSFTGVNWLLVSAWDAMQGGAKGSEGLQGFGYWV